MVAVVKIITGAVEACALSFTHVREWSGNKSILPDLRVPQSIERFHWRGQHLCIIIETKGSFCIRKVFNSRIGLEHQHGRRFIILLHSYSGHEVVWKRSIVGGRKHSKTLVGRTPVLTRNARVFETNRPHLHVFLDPLWDGHLCKTDT